MFGEPLSDRDYITRDELNEALREREVFGDNDTIAVDHTASGVVVRSIMTMPATEDLDIIGVNYDQVNDEYQLFWQEFQVPIVRSELPGTQVIYETVSKAQFNISASDFANPIQLWLGYIDSTLEMFWSYDGTATGGNTYTTDKEVTSVNSKKLMGIPFRVTANLTSGDVPYVVGDNTAIPQVNFADDLAWNYNSSTKTITVYITNWNPGLGDGDDQPYSTTYVLGNSFSDRIILAWDGITNTASIDKFGTSTPWLYTRTIGSFATDSSGNLTHGWIDTAAMMAFGLTRQSDSWNHTDDLDVDTTDQVTFDRENRDYQIRNGLIEKITVTDLTDVIFTVDEWTGIEKGGKFFHKYSPADSTGSAFHWVTLGWTTAGGLTVDGSPVTALEVNVDTKGHIWEYNSTGQPSTTNYRYRHCTNYPSQSDLIFASQATGNTIEVVGECYDFLTTTEEAVTSPTPTIIASYANCTSCAAAVVNGQWNYCTAPTVNAAVLSATHTDVDYAWLCLSSIWRKCFLDHNTSTTGSDPSVFKQCDDAAPASCNDLLGLPASDDFSGSGCESGSVGDVNDGIRWSHTLGTIAIGGGELSHTGNGGGVIEARSTNQYGSLSGNFLVSTDATINTAQGAGNYTVASRLMLDLAAGYDTGILVSLNGSGHAAPGWQYEIQYGGSSVKTGASSALTSMKITRSGTTVTFYINGSSVHSLTSSYTFNGVVLWSVSVNRGEYDIDYDNFLQEDGASGELYIDPSGSSCT